MTSPPTPQPDRLRLFLPWFMLLLGLVIGYAVGRVSTNAKGGPLGNCIRRDTSSAAKGVTQQSCQASCPTCTWEQS